MPRPARSLLLPLFVAAFAAPALTQPVAYSPALSAAENAAWRQYTDATERRIARELATAGGFLALDFGASAAADRQAVLSGLMPVADMQTTQADGRAIEVPGRLVHHWRGAVLLPGTRLDHVFTRLQAEVPGTGKGDVLASAILGRNGPRLRVFIKVKRTKVITVVYNTEHLVTFHRRTPTRGSSTSLATKIAQLADAGTSSEHEVGAGHDFLLRWNSYWRYEEVPAGVIAECESISLSRTPPLGMGLLLGAIVRGTARESMERALLNLRGHFQTPPAWSPAR